jgi:hypothetical protein
LASEHHQRTNCADYLVDQLYDDRQHGRYDYDGPDRDDHWFRVNYGTEDHALAPSNPTYDR